MSNLREKIIAIRAEKLAKPPVLVAYRIMAEPRVNYKVVYEYKHYMQDDSEYVTHQFTTFKEAVADVVKAEKGDIRQ